MYNANLLILNLCFGYVYWKTREILSIYADQKQVDFFKKIIFCDPRFFLCLSNLCSIFFISLVSYSSIFAFAKQVFGQSVNSQARNDRYIYIYIYGHTHTHTYANACVYITHSLSFLFPLPALWNSLIFLEEGCMNPPSRSLFSSALCFFHLSQPRST